MSRWGTYLLSSIIAGGVSWCGAFLAVATNLDPGASISWLTWMVISVTAVAAALKDLQAHATAPPQ